MNEDLYYCRGWTHQPYEDYDICVSELVEDERGAMAQIHCGIYSDNKIVRISHKVDIQQFERKVRGHVRDFIAAMGMMHPGRDENLTVKMWYYEPGGGELDMSNIPLRIAVTFYKPVRIGDREKELLKKQIFDELCGLLKSQRKLYI